MAYIINTYKLTPTITNPSSPSESVQTLVNAFRRLANEGLGEVEEIKGKRGTKVVSELHGPA